MQGRNQGNVQGETSYFAFFFLFSLMLGVILLDNGEKNIAIDRHTPPELFSLNESKKKTVSLNLYYSILRIIFPFNGIKPCILSSASSTLLYKRFIIMRIAAHHIHHLLLSLLFVFPSLAHL